MIQILHVKSFESTYRAGYTHPFLVTCDDGLQYVAKTINEQCDGKALFNELVASRLALLLNLPIPEFTVGKITADIIDSTPILDTFGVKPGLCFLSRLLKGSAGITPILLKKAQNKSDFPGIMLFDQIIMNVDRGENTGNWFYVRTTHKLNIIDHGNIFRLAQIWSVQSLEQDKNVPPVLLKELNAPQYAYIRRFFPTGPNPFWPTAHRFQKLTNEEIASCFKEIPEQWGMSDEEIKAANDFILFQQQHISDIVSELEIKFKTRKGA